MEERKEETKKERKKARKKEKDSKNIKVTHIHDFKIKQKNCFHVIEA